MNYKVTIEFDTYKDVIDTRDILTSLLAESYVKEKLSALNYKRLAVLRNQIFSLPKLKKDSTFEYLGHTFELCECRLNGDNGDYGDYGDYTDKVVCFMYKYDENGDLLSDKLIPWYSYGADDIIKEGEQVPDSLLAAIDKILEV